MDQICINVWSAKSYSRTPLFITHECPYLLVPWSGVDFHIINCTFLPLASTILGHFNFFSFMSLDINITFLVEVYLINLKWVSMWLSSNSSGITMQLSGMRFTTELIACRAGLLLRALYAKVRKAQSLSFFCTP